jgi:hypothetical protein
MDAKQLVRNFYCCGVASRCSKESGCAVSAPATTATATGNVLATATATATGSIGVLAAAATTAANAVEMAAAATATVVLAMRVNSRAVMIQSSRQSELSNTNAQAHRSGVCVTTNVLCILLFHFCTAAFASRFAAPISWQIAL